VKLGFCVNSLLPRARGGGALKMGLVALAEQDWLAPTPNRALRGAAFDAHPGSLARLPAAESPGAELAALLGLSGGLEHCARAHWEDMCLLTRAPGEEAYRLVGAAVAFPSDWHPADKLGLTLPELHEPIHGYREQLASGVDHFIAQLAPGPIFGRANWFVTPTPELRWIAEDPAVAFAAVTPANAGETLFVRSERQTLRKLPRTGAVLFTIGVYVAPLASLTPDNLHRIAAAVGSIGAGEAGRRGAPAYAPALLDYAAARAAAIGLAS
jgi:hypothetical protein